MRDTQFFFRANSYPRLLAPASSTLLPRTLPHPLKLSMTPLPHTPRVSLKLSMKTEVLPDIDKFKRAVALIFFVDVKFNKVGRSVKVIINEVINPKVIIQPKSMIGFISLKIKDKKAITVVRTVYKIGQNILLVVKVKISKLVFDG